MVSVDVKQHSTNNPMRLTGRLVPKNENVIFSWRLESADLADDLVTHGVLVIRCGDKRWPKLVFVNLSHLRDAVS